MTPEEMAEVFDRNSETDYQNGVRAAVLIIAGLCGLCVLASLRGCP